MGPATDPVVAPLRARITELERSLADATAERDAISSVFDAYVADTDAEVKRLRGVLAEVRRTLRAFYRSAWDGTNQVYDEDGPSVGSVIDAALSEATP